MDQRNCSRQRVLSTGMTVLWLTCSSSAFGEDVSVVVDHVSRERKVREIAVQPGDRVSVAITNTCPDRFDYQALALQSAATVDSNAATADSTTCTADEARAKLVREGFCELKTASLSFTHARSASGYEITIRTKPNQPSVIRGLTKPDLDSAVTKMVGDAKCEVPKDATDKSKPLEAFEYFLTVKSSPWALGMSGGLTISDVVDPRFAIVPDSTSTTTPPATIVIRDRSAEDSEKLGFAGFLHVHNEGWKLGDVPIAGTFGLGIQEKNSISGFIGVSAAAFDLAYLTLGWNWSSIDRLPAGQELGAAPINANVLNNLPTRTDSGWFLGVSFKLMSPGEAFFKQKVTTQPQAEPGGVKPQTP